MPEQTFPTTAAGRTIGDYANAVASGSPTPGGGSVVGVTGSLAAGLVEMVCHLTLAGKCSDEAAARLPEIAGRAAELRQRLQRLAVDDERAYAGYRAAVAMAKGTDEEKAARRAAMEQALHVAADAPLQTAATCSAVLDLALEAASLGTAHALSDISTAAMLANASLRGALLNVRVNAHSMKAADRAATLLREAEALETSGQQGEAATLSAIANRTARG